jgi:hypothetical protein
MEKKIEGYLHLYLGCECWDEYDDNTKRLFSVSSDNCVLFKKTTHTRDFREVKPILRPLSDMTQLEADTIWEILDWNERIIGPVRIEDLIMEFSPIEDYNGGANNAHWGYFCKILPTLLSNSFDLFGLIESGLAIDATTVKNDAVTK